MSKRTLNRHSREKKRQDDLQTSSTLLMFFILFVILDSSIKSGQLRFYEKNGSIKQRRQMKG